MSDEQKTTVEADEKVAAKLDTLFQRVYMPAFMEKLAARGVTPQNEEELQGVLKIAMCTRLHQDAGTEQTKPTMIKEAASKLEALTFGNQDLVDQVLADPEVASVFQS